MNGQYTCTEVAVLAHPKQLFEARKYKNPKTGKEQGEPKFSGQFVFEKGAEWKALRLHALKVAQAEWPGIKWGDFSTPFKDGTVLADKRKAENEKRKQLGEKTKPEAEYQRGKGVITASSQRQPLLSADIDGKIVDFVEDAAKAQAKSRFYFGVEVLALFNMVASEVDNKKYVTIYLNAVLSTGKGKKLAGGPSGQDVWKGYKGSVSSEDPTDDPTDDEIPY